MSMKPSKKRVLDKLVADVEIKLSGLIKLNPDDYHQHLPEDLRLDNYVFGFFFGVAYSIYSGIGLPGGDFDYVQTKVMENSFSLDRSAVIQRLTSLQKKNDESYIKGLTDAHRASNEAFDEQNIVIQAFRLNVKTRHPSIKLFS